MSTSGLKERACDVIMTTKYYNGEEGEFWRNLYRGSIFSDKFVEEMGASEIATADEDSIANIQITDDLLALENYVTYLGKFNPSWKDEESAKGMVSLTHDNAVADCLKSHNKGKEMLGLPPRPILEIEPMESRLESCPFKIEKNEIFGRHFVSNRAISKGEIVLIEPPMIVAPLSKHPYCLNCLSRTTAEYYCPECGLFICSLECKTEMHEWECSVFARLKLMDETDNLKRFQNDQIKARIEALPVEKRPQAEIIWKHAKEAALQARKDESMRFYPLIAVSRTYIAMRRSNFVKSLILSLQANVNKKARQYAVNQQHIVSPLSKKIWEEETPSVFHRIAAVWDTNSFEVSFGWQNRGQGLYPGATLLTHSCKSNLQQWFTEDGVMVIRALEDIPDNTLLTICYSEPLWPTRVRIDHLELTKNFSCSCIRCSHPTELDSYMGSLKCSECQNYLIPENPKDPGSLWHCTEPCTFTITAKEVVAIDSKSAPSLRNIGSGDLETRKNILKEYLEKYHPNHHLITRLHLGFIDHYSKKELTECDDETLEALIESTEQAMIVLRITDAVLSNKRTRTGREYLRCRLEKLRRNRERNSDVDIKAELLALKEQLDDSSLVLSWDHRMPSMEDTIALYEMLSQ